MNSSNILSIITFVYGLAAFLFIAFWVFKKQILEKSAYIITIVGVCGHTVAIIMRWVESYKLHIGHAPFSNMYESLIFFSWVICVVYIIIERKYGNRIIGAFATTLAFFAMAYASLSPNIDSRIQPLVPALKSNWLIAHVITCFIGYSAFAISAGVSLMYILKEKDKENKSSFLGVFPKIEVLNELNYQLIMFGFLFLTIGIISGSVWANSAWGRYWGWDPKETWSLITWFIYALLLHARMMRGWNGKRIAWLSILGFLAVLFTYFGVNYLPGLHSYSSAS